MVTRKTQAKIEPSQLDRDAKEFGVGVRCGGWRLGLLVARNVAPAKPGRPAANKPSLEMEKVSMTRFAEIAGVSQSHVTYYYNAWELAAEAGLVPRAIQINLGDEDVDIDIDSIEVEDNPRTQWSHFYTLAKNPPEKSKAQEKQQDSKPKEKAEDKVDQDFGIQPDEDEDDSMTESQRAEADSAITRNVLIEVLESVSAVRSRVERAEVGGDHAELLLQIQTAAKDLMDLAATLAYKDGPQLKAV